MELRCQIMKSERKPNAPSEGSGDRLETLISAFSRLHLMFIGRRTRTAGKVEKKTDEMCKEKKDNGPK